MYIQYTSVDLACLLIYQVSRVVLLQWPFPSLQKHSVSGFGSALGFFVGVTTCLSIYLKFHFLSLCPFLETSDLVNHQHLMLFLDFYLRWFQHHEELGNHFHHPLHTIVHHEVLLTWWWWLENFVNHYFIWKINSHLIQAIVAPRHSKHMLTSWAILLHLVGKRTCQRSHTSQHGHEPEIPISALGTSHMLCDVSKMSLVPRF